MIVRAQEATVAVAVVAAKAASLQLNRPSSSKGVETGAASAITKRPTTDAETMNMQARMHSHASAAAAAAAMPVELSASNRVICSWTLS